MTLPFAQLSFPEVYERELVGPLFRPWAQDLVDELGVGGGDRLLDIACGTGIVARLAAERIGEPGRVVGIDLSPAMIAVARRLTPSIDWREGDAAALPLGDAEQFDVVVCQQGLQFVPDKPAAARQMRRATAPGGRLAISTWRPEEEAPFVRALRDVAERHVGPIVDRRHSYGESAPVDALLREAGFENVRSMVVSKTLHFTDGSVFVRLNAMALIGMSADAKSIGEDERGRIAEAITEESAGVLRQYSDGTGLHFEIATNVATATA